MRCSEFRDYLDDFCRGLSKEEQTRLMQAHIESCELCAAEYRQHKSLLSLLGDEPEQVIEPAELTDFLPGVWEKIKARPGFSFKTWAVRLVPAAVITAFLAFMIFRPAIENGTNGVSDFSYTEDNLLFSPGYFSYEQDSAYSDDEYYTLLDNVLADDMEALELIEQNLYGETGIFANGSYDLEYLSDESLELLDEKIDELLNNVG